MDLPRPLYTGTLIKRYKRFLADVRLDNGDVITAHCANSGSMKSLLAEGAQVVLSYHDNPKRKLKYSWELVRAQRQDGTWGDLVGINTSLPNRIVEEAIRDGEIAELTGYATLRREVKYGKNSRIDILLDDGNGPSCYVEVKNVTLSRQDGLAEFPDAVTSRGAKHLLELSDMVAEGHRAVMFYLVQRPDCDRFAIARDLDPTYAEGLKAAQSAGVEVLIYGCQVTPEHVVIDPDMKIEKVD